MNADNKVQTADYTQFEESQSRRKHLKEPLERDETKDNSYQNTGEMSIVKERKWLLIWRTNINYHKWWWEYYGMCSWGFCTLPDTAGGALKSSSSWHSCADRTPGYNFSLASKKAHFV